MFTKGLEACFSLWNSVVKILQQRSIVAFSVTEKNHNTECGLMVSGWTGARTCALAICCLKPLGLLPAGAAVPASQRKCGFHLAYWGGGKEGRVFWVKEQRRERGMESKEHEGAVRRGCPSNPYLIFIPLGWLWFWVGPCRIWPLWPLRS